MQDWTRDAHGFVCNERQFNCVQRSTRVPSLWKWVVKRIGPYRFHIYKSSPERFTRRGRGVWMLPWPCVQIRPNDSQINSPAETYQTVRARTRRWEYRGRGVGSGVDVVAGRTDVAGPRRNGLISKRDSSRTAHVVTAAAHLMWQRKTITIVRRVRPLLFERSVGNPTASQSMDLRTRPLVGFRGVQSTPSRSPSTRTTRASAAFPGPVVFPIFPIIFQCLPAHLTWPERRTRADGVFGSPVRPTLRAFVPVVCCHLLISSLKPTVRYRPSPSFTLTTLLSTRTAYVPFCRSLFHPRPSPVTINRTITDALTNTRCLSVLIRLLRSYSVWLIPIWPRNV